ncbi:MAG: lipoyl(octanoyl) transferase LipB [Deltaproteobacteria bacterium]|nr:lipoyl(octanoyl) transferase LipB [Deltaproteobacteria bacterium]
MSANLSNTVEWLYIEKLDYSSGLCFQDELRRRALSNGDKSKGFLLLCDHKPVITVGRFGKEDNILGSRDDLKKYGIEIYRTERGGDVTFHGPGQLVGYPIINLRDFKLGVKSYVHLLEETIIRVLKDFDIEGERIEKYPGVWIGKEKIAAIGVHVKKHITAHGFALNVNTNLSYFSLIVPCGIRNMGVTSIEKVLGKDIPLEQVALGFVKEFGRVFRSNLKCISL